MHCSQCHERIGQDWIELQHRHIIRLGEFHGEIGTVERVTLCALPRVCAMEYVEQATTTASRIKATEMGDEPF